MDQPSEIRKQAATAWDVILLILSSVCLILIVLAVLVFCVYKKRQGLRIKAPSQDSMQLVYAEVTHSARNRTDTRPSTSPVQNEGVEYGTVVTSNQKKKECSTESWCLTLLHKKRASCPKYKKIVCTQESSAVKIPALEFEVRAQGQSRYSAQEQGGLRASFKGPTVAA